MCFQFKTAFSSGCTPSSDKFPACAAPAAADVSPPGLSAPQCREMDAVDDDDDDGRAGAGGG